MKKLNYVQKVRWKKKLTVRQLSKLSGVSHSMISKVENGQVYPSQIVIILLSNALEMKAEELFILDYAKIQDL